MEHEDREVFRMVNDHLAGETVGIIIPVEEAREYAAWKRWKREQQEAAVLRDAVILITLGILTVLALIALFVR